MERDDGVFPARRKASYVLSDGRLYWKSGQVPQWVDGAFCQPLPDEMVDRGMPFGPKYVSIEPLAERARSIRPASKHTQAMRHQEELDAVGRIKGLETVRSDLAERQAEVDAEMTRLLQRVPLAGLYVFQAA